jgi:hypothetical protein
VAPESGSAFQMENFWGKFWNTEYFLRKQTLANQTFCDNFHKNEIFAKTFAKM